MASPAAFAPVPAFAPAPELVIPCSASPSPEDLQATLAWRIGGLFGILIASSIGFVVPFLLRKDSHKSGLFVFRAFAAGVVLATGLVHVLPDATETLSDPCLGLPEDFPWTPVFATFAALLAFTFEYYMREGLLSRIGRSSAAKSAKAQLCAPGDLECKECEVDCGSKCSADCAECPADCVDCELGPQCQAGTDACTVAAGCTATAGCATAACGAARCPDAACTQAICSDTTCNDNACTEASCHEIQCHAVACGSAGCTVDDCKDAACTGSDCCPPACLDCVQSPAAPLGADSLAVPLKLGSLAVPLTADSLTAPLKLGSLAAPLPADSNLHVPFPRPGVQGRDFQAGTACVAGDAECVECGGGASPPAQAPPKGAASKGAALKGPTKAGGSVRGASKRDVGGVSPSSSVEEGLVSGDRERERLLTYRAAALTLEAGIVFHSVFIGVALGTSHELDYIKGLAIALCFHQGFEGISLGSALVKAQLKPLKVIVLGVIFVLTTPVGICIGMALGATYNPSSPVALAIEGAFGAASAGILLYAALVDLVHPTFDPTDPSTPKHKGVIGMGFLAMFLGAGCMCVLALWA